MAERRTIQIAQPDTGDEEWHALREPLLSGWLTQGPQVSAFERAFAERHGARHALATTSCTTALHLILAAMEVGPGDEVVVPSLTWIATANVVLYCGATPVFADIDPETFNLDPNDLAARVTKRTKAVMAVHLFGLCADMDAIRMAAPEIPIIEDAACATGATYKGRPAGTLGEAAAFSFHPRKSVTTGEGGMVTTADGQLAERVNMLRNHGASISEEARHRGPRPHVMPEFNLLGFNYRMTDLQAAMGLVQLRKLDRYLAEREARARYYRERLADLEWLELPKVPDGYTHGWQSFVCRIHESRSRLTRNEIMDRLHAEGISTRPGTHAVHMLGYYRNRFGLRPEDLSAARDAERFSIALPLHNRMTDDDFERVVDALHKVQ
jgi:perosamine synthetase